MPENNQKVVKYDLVKEIRTEYNQEILDWLKDNHYNYKVWEIKDLLPYQSKEDINEVPPLICLPSKLYQKLKKLSEFIGEDLHEFSSNLLEKTIESFEMDPYQDLSYWLPRKKLLKKIFGTGE